MGNEARNKQLALDMWQAVIVEFEPEAVLRYIAPGYIQHNPAVPPGREFLYEAVKQLAAEHPICRGWKEHEFEDEYYLNPTIEKAKPLLAVTERGGKEVIVGWVHEREGGGRAFATTLGHPYRNFQDERFRRMIVNGILWAAHVEVPEEGARVDVGEAALALPPQK